MLKYNVGKVLSPGGALMQLFELYAELVAFFMEYSMYLKEWQNNYKLWLFWLDFGPTFTEIMNEVSLSLQRKQPASVHCH